MPQWLSRIEASLRAHDKEYRLWPAGDGQLLVTPHGARLLACGLAGVEGNLFWHHADVEDPTKAGPAIRGAGGGFGGDRLWIGPEVAFMWRDLAEARVDPFTNYTLPPSMDPGDWRIAEESAGHIRLVAQADLTDYRVNKRMRLRLDRQFDVAGAPDGLPKGLRHAGFVIRNEITMLDAPAGAMAGLWDLLQLPPGGDLICPTLVPVKKPTSYYAPFGKHHVKCTRQYVRFKIDSKRRCKMGLSATQTSGRMGFFRRAGKTATLIVRIFQPLPGEPYLSVARASNAFFGGAALEAYNDDGNLGGFGEMEHHDPAVIAGKTPHSRVGTSITHVLAGSDAAVRKAGVMLLGVEV